MTGHPTIGESSLRSSTCAVRIGVRKLAKLPWRSNLRQPCKPVLELQEQPHEVRLLADCRKVFHETDADQLSARDIISGLCNLPETDWAVWIYQKPISEKCFADLLRRFGIRSKKGGPRNDSQALVSPGFCNVLAGLRAGGCGGCGGSKPASRSSTTQQIMNESRARLVRRHSFFAPSAPSARSAVHGRIAA